MPRSYSLAFTLSLSLITDSSAVPGSQDDREWKTLLKMNSITLVDVLQVKNGENVVVRYDSVLQE